MDFAFCNRKGTGQNWTATKKVLASRKGMVYSDSRLTPETDVISNGGICNGKIPSDCRVTGKSENH